MKNTPAQQGRIQRAWILYDWANSGFATVMLTAVFPVYFLAQVPDEGVVLGGHRIMGPALWGYILSLSMLTIALLAPYLGALADHGSYRNRFLTVLGSVGAMATCALGLPVEPNLVVMIVLFCVANLGFAGGNLFYNALLPLICQPNEMDRLSARGYAVGYIGGGVLLLLGFGLIQGHTFVGLADPASASRTLFILTGVWWLLFALPCYKQVNDPADLSPPKKPKGYFRVFAELKNEPNALLFLLAFLCYNDGIMTLITVSSVFASEELGLDQTTILACFLLIQFCAMPGTLLCERVSRWIGVRATILCTLGLFTGITLFARGMQTATEFWVLGGLVALGLGGSQALSRSLFSQLIPKEKSAEFFGFYAVSNKFASILGPLTFALFADLTGNTRNAVLTLSIFFIIGALLLTAVRLPATADKAC